MKHLFNFNNGIHGSYAEIEYLATVYVLIVTILFRGRRSLQEVHLNQDKTNNDDWRMFNFACCK